MNVCVPLVPPVCETVIVRVPIVAPLAMTKLQVNELSLTATTFVTVTPVPLTATARPATPLV